MTEHAGSDDRAVTPPRLVLVGGAPASGKSTLAHRVAGMTALPLLARDGLKEVLFDTLGAPDRARSRELGAASFALLFAVIGWLLDAGVGAVVDCNFRRGRSEDELRPLVARADAIQIHCEAEPGELIRRYEERTARGERHQGHHDRAALPELIANLQSGAFEPLDLPIPLLRVDTGAGYRPEVAEIERFVRTAGKSSPVMDYS